MHRVVPQWTHARNSFAAARAGRRGTRPSWCLGVRPLGDVAAVVALFYHVLDDERLLVERRRLEEVGLGAAQTLPRGPSADTSAMALAEEPTVLLKEPVDLGLISSRLRLPRHEGFRMIRMQFVSAESLADRARGGGTTQSKNTHILRMSCANTHTTHKLTDANHTEQNQCSSSTFRTTSPLPFCSA